MLKLINKLLVVYSYVIAAFYFTFGFLKVTGAKLDVLMQKYFALLWRSDVSDLQETIAFFLIAFVMWGIAYLMDRKSIVGYALAAVLIIWEMVLAKLFYWDVLYRLSPTFWDAFWAWEHFLLGVPFLISLFFLIDNRLESDKVSGKR